MGELNKKMANENLVREVAQLYELERAYQLAWG
ncbi:hypothetical protein N007_05775 [Alicyclobacillus acidoterrestris ATCC 49025]|nr:hypothetical protein N007_05775 [Alicyclobacillus acidoterrestris ATCC 49025]